MTQTNTSKIILTALMMGIIIVATMMIRVPIPFTQGYVHLGDGMIFLGVLILGWKYGAAAGGIGSMLGDVIGGFAMWAPWTLVIKGAMALIMGLFIAFAAKKERSRIQMVIMQLAGMIFAGLFMVIGYFVAEGLMYGNWVVAALGIPWNIGQFVVGMVIAAAIEAALYKTTAGKMFEYRTGRDKQS